MKVEFEKIGLGCDICIAKSKLNCPGCERNPGLLRLRDNFKRPEKKPPLPPVKDDVSKGKISRVNRAQLRQFGIHIPEDPISDKFSTTPPPVEERADPGPPPEGLELGDGAAGAEGEGPRP